MLKTASSCVAVHRCACVCVHVCVCMGVCACVCGIFVYTHASMTIYFNFLCSWDIRTTLITTKLEWLALLHQTCC